MKQEYVMDDRKVLRSRIVMGIWLVIFWCVLWHDYGLGTILSGIVVAGIITWRYKLPPVLLSGRFNIFWTMAFAIRLIYKLVVASIKVAWLAIAQGPNVSNAVLGVQLRSKDDLVLTAVGHTLALIPGSLVIEMDRSTSTLYLHSMDARNEDDVRKFREDAILTEDLIVRAIGIKSEVEQINKDAKARKAGQLPADFGVPPYQQNGEEKV